MLNPTFKAEWLAALRSGKYPKGKGCLKDTTYEPPHFCCLGVAAEIREFSTLGCYLSPEEALSVGLSYNDMLVLAGINDYTEDFENVIQHIEQKL